MVGPLYGTDVSSNNPTKTGRTYNNIFICFTFVKATEGVGYTNPSLKYQVDYAESYGDQIGLYQFLHSGNIASQISKFKRETANLYDPGMIIAVDWETYKVNGTSHMASTNEKNAMIKGMQAAYPHSRVILYCNKSDWFKTDNECGDGLWIAAPSDPDGKPDIKHPWVFQQISSANHQDWNIANFESFAALRKWARHEEGHVPMVDTPDPKSKTYIDVWNTDSMPKPESAPKNTNLYYSAETMLRTAADNATKALANTEKIMKHLGLD